MQTLISDIDNSVNFVEEQLKGFIESRYVRRTNDYFIAYLSSQTGCNRGCRFCHLTTTKQTQFEDVTIREFIDQARNVFLEYDPKFDSPKLVKNFNIIQAKYVHFNFMARGEPLCNPSMQEDSFTIFSELAELAKEADLYPKFNISTIMPRDCNYTLSDMFRVITPTIYYSIYSTNPDFRRKWMPNAISVNDALDQLKEYQELSKKIIKFHCAFIADENDHPRDVTDMMETIKDKQIIGEFNIVRYNPYSLEQGIETDHLNSIKKIISLYMPVKIITRVGEDVKASCGMFVDKNA